VSRRRLERVTELIHQEVSKRIPLLKDPGLGFITILAVRLSPDFHQAKVFYSVLGSQEEQERTRAALEKARYYLRGQLGSLESLKTPPELIFVQDHSAEEAAKVLDVLNQLEKDRNAIAAPDYTLPSPTPDKVPPGAIPQLPAKKTSKASAKKSPKKHA
jgi:ribosome-binding factor A